MVGNRGSDSALTGARILRGFCLSLVLGAWAFAPGLIPRHAVAQDLEQVPAFIVQQYLDAAESGDARAQFRLGLLHERGLIPGPDPQAEAARWFDLAADGGHAAAQFKRATMYAEGRGGPEDQAAAVALYRLAAEQGLGEAQFNLALHLQNGIGTDRNIGDAILWYEQAAFRRIAGAPRALGLLYLSDIGETPNDRIEAWAWLTLAADEGDALADTHLNDLEGSLSAVELEEARQLAAAYRQLRLVPVGG